MGNSGNAVAEWRNYWFLPIAAALGYATSVIHVYSIGPFIEPLQAEFGWARAEVTGGLALSSLISALFCIPVGLMVDRVGPRRVALAGVVMIAGCYALLGTATGSTTNWMLLWTLLALGTIGVQTTVWTAAVTSRFEASRGLALAITLSGASFAATVFPILATWMIGNLGWRHAFFAQAGAWLMLVLPVLSFGFHGARDRAGSDGAAAQAIELHGVDFAEGLRSPALYKLLLASGLFTFTAVGSMVHFVPILTGAGAEPLSAAGIASLIGVFSVVGRLGTGFILDRFQGHLVGAGACLFPVIAAVLLLQGGGNAVSQSFAAVSLGLTLGAEVDVIAYLASRHFGLKSFGALYGALVMALALGTASGPLVAGMLFDRFGGYSQYLILAAAMMVISALALLSLGPAPPLRKPEPSHEA